MKVLAIDAGNTRLKWAFFDGLARVRNGWLPTRDSTGLGAALETVHDVDCIVVANVAGERVRDAIVDTLKRHGAPQRWLVASRECCGVKSGYAQPAQLGADRWAALIGARAHYDGACVVINAGTTMTVDALSPEGVFLGGCIVPGVELMQDALAHNTAQLPRMTGSFLYFPDNTADAIASGAVNALAGAVDRMVGYLQHTVQHEPLVVLSGGAADMLEPHLRGRVERIDDLVLQGLLQVAIEEEQEAKR